jgi:hypothetical protein
LVFSIWAALMAKRPMSVDLNLAGIVFAMSEVWDRKNE